MSELPTTELTAIAIICLFLIKELFAFLKTKKQNGDNNITKTQLILLNQKMDNHITQINKEIVEIKEDVREVKRDVSEIRFKINK